MKSVIIDRLIQIEESAQTITKGIEKKETLLPVMINEKCEEIESKLKAEYEKNARETQRIKQAEGEKKLAEIEKEYIQRGKNLDELYAKCHEDWENEIFNRIIGR